jgi:membrane associated rhomboid family serine protease
MYNLSNNPVCSFISTILIVIFLLSFINIVKFYPCNENMLSNFISNFFHVDILHLLSNLYGLYVISRVEQNVGPLQFSVVIFLILFINTVIETVAHKLFNTPCSIGFSAILYGVLAWEIASGNKDPNYFIIIAIIFDAISSYYLNRKIAVMSHIIGIITGIILAIIQKKLNLFNNTKKLSKL